MHLTTNRRPAKLPPPICPHSLWVHRQHQTGELVDDCFQLDPQAHYPLDPDAVPEGSGPLSIAPIWVVKTQSGDVFDVHAFLATYEPV